MCSFLYLASVLSEACSLPRIIHGQVSYKRESVGSIVSFQCEEGFKLVGSPTLECITDSRWSGFFPECKGLKYIKTPNS